MRKKVTSKRFISLVLSAILCFASCTTVFASADNVNDDVYSVAATGETVSPTSLGDCIASDAIIVSVYGEIKLHLDKSYNGLYFRALATGNANVFVDCTLVLPDGGRVELGIIQANGEKTPYLIPAGKMPAGDYTFEFLTTSEDKVACAGLIYTNY